nr:hypothetical protein [Tanacetum cinerariifolium]
FLGEILCWGRSGEGSGSVMEVVEWTGNQERGGEWGWREKRSQKLKTVSYHKLYDILKQHQNEVNEIRAKRIARTANPLTLVAQQQPVYHHQNHPTHYTQNFSTRSQQAATRNRGKTIVNSPQPIYDQEPSMVAEDDEMSKDKEIDKLMALISLSFKKIYKPTNNNLQTSSNTSRANHDNSLRINRGAGYDNQRLANVAGAKETVEVSPDAADSGPIFDAEPLQKVSNNDHYNVFAIESEHPEQSKSVHDTYPIEQDGHNVIIDSLDMSYDREQIDQNDDDNDLANEREFLASLNEKLKCKIDDSKNRNKFLETSNKKEAQIKLYKTREDKELDKVIAIENKVKVLDNIVYKTGQSVQTMNMLNSKCRTSFAKPEFLKKVRRVNPHLYDIGYYNDNLALMLTPESDEDKGTAISELKKLIEKLKGKSVDTKFGKSSVTRQPNAFKSHRPSILGKLTIFSYSLKRKDFSMSKSVTKNNVSNDFSKPVTAHILPPIKKSILKNTNVLAPGMYKLNTNPTQTRTSQLPNDSRKSNKCVSFSIGVIPTTSISRPKLKSNQKEDRVLLNNSQGKKQEVEDHRRIAKFSKNKMSVTACNDSLKAKTSNVTFVCATCGTCVLNDKHDMCVLKSVAKPLRKPVVLESNQKPRNSTRKIYKHISEASSWWYLKFTPSGYKWKPKSGKENVNSNVSMPLGNASRTANVMDPMTYRRSTVSNTPLLLILLQLVEIVLFIVDSGCSKHMMGNLKLLINFMEKFLGTVKIRNDQIAPILGYGGDLVQGAVTIKRVYYVERLNHNLFSVSQLCDADLEVAFQKSTCYIRDLKGNDLLTCSHGTDLYSITLQDTTSLNPICLMAKATLS